VQRKRGRGVYKLDPEGENQGEGEEGFETCLKKIQTKGFG
jgi:hypothetical protein